MKLVRVAILILVAAGLTFSGRAAFCGAKEDWAEANRMVGQGKLDPALQLYDKALTDQDASPRIRARIFTSRGVAWRMKGDLDSALTDFRKALALDNDLKEAYLNRGNLWRLKGRPYKALADYSKALELDPRWAPPYHGIAWLMATSRDDQFRNAQTALDMAEKAVSLERNSNHLDTLAAAHAQGGRFEEAIKAQEEALALLESEGRLDKREVFERRLNSYRAGEPWRE